MAPGPVPETVVAPGPAFALRILHLSDLHEGQPGREALWRRGVSWAGAFPLPTVLPIKAI